MWKCRVVVTVGLLGLGGAGCGGSSQKGAEESVEAAVVESEKAASERETSSKYVDCRALETEAREKSAGRFDPSKLPLRATGPVLTVNGEDVTAGEFHDYVRTQVPEGYLEGPTTPSGKKVESGFARMMRQGSHGMVLRFLIKSEVMRQALDDSSVKVERTAFEKRLEKYKKEEVPKEKTFEEHLEDEYMVAEQVHARVCRGLQREAFVEQYDTTVSEADVRSYYDSNIDDFTKPARLNGRLILLKVGDGSAEETRKKAEALVERIRSGEKFAAVAKEASEGPRAEKGGKLEKIEVEKFPDPVVEQLDVLGTGKVSDPIRADVQTMFGGKQTIFYILRVDERIPEKQVAFEKFREKIRKQLEAQAERRPLRFIMRELREKASVEIHSENLEEQE